MRSFAKRMQKLGLPVIWCMGVCEAVPAIGASIPESAHSLSLNLRSEFLDYTSLIFQYPNRAGLLNSEVFAFNSTANEFGVGAIGNSTSNGIFVAGHRAPAVLAGGTTQVQTGWGVAWKALSLGLAFRGARFQDETIVTDVFLDRLTVSGARNLDVRYEGAFGLGLTAERATLDFAVGVVVEDLEFSTASVSSDTFALVLENDNDPFLDFNLRGALRLTEAIELILIGAVSTPERTWTGTELIGTTQSAVAFRREFDMWSAGIALALSTQHIDWVAFSADWRVQESPSNRSLGGGAEFLTLREEGGGFAVSLDQNVWRDLDIRAGVALRYLVLERLGQDRFDSDRGRSFSTRTDEFQESFAWGAAYSWRNFEFHGSASTTLDINRLFLALDARIGL